MSSGTVHMSSVGEGRERVRRLYANGKSQAAGLRLDDDFLPLGLMWNIEILNAPKNGHYPITPFLPYFMVKRGGYLQKVLLKGPDVIDENSKSRFCTIPHFLTIGRWPTKRFEDYSTLTYRRAARTDARRDCRLKA